MTRWRLIVMPMLVTAVGVGVWAASRPRESEPYVVPRENLIDTPKVESLDEILLREPIKFFPMSLKKYDETIRGYACMFDKRERINGKLRNPEKVEVRFQEDPFSVFMEWKEGGGIAGKALYVKDQFDNKIVARGASILQFAPLQIRDIDDADAKARGRFTIAQFGFKQSTQRTFAKAKNALDRGKLHLRYEGIVPVEKLKGEKCHKFIRTPFEPPEEDQLNELTVYYDQKHWLQVGAVLKDIKGDLLGEYWFTDIVVNPIFGPKQFTKEGL